MKPITNKIYYLLLPALLASCQWEQKPLQVLPFTARRIVLQEDSTWKGIDIPVPGIFYIRNFRNDKESLKELLGYIKDSVPSWKLFDCYHTAYFYKRNRGLSFEGDEADVDQKYSFYANYLNEDTRYFKYFKTWSKVWLNNTDFQEKGDRNFQVHTQGDTAKVTFPYKEFNTDVWQKFLNTVFYEREHIKYKDYDQHNLWINREKRYQFTDWSAPTTYILIHPKSGEKECIIHYPFNRNYSVFSMDIL
ncbi:MAG: hypothetical protein LUF85_16195 [Bacteroides sp.]|nr:hypothetical protein [Bacteroides sp.]